MSANVDSMAYTGEEPWHGLGEQLDDDPDTMTIFRRSGLDWKVTKTPIYADLRNPDLDGLSFTDRGVEAPDHVAVVRSDTADVLGVHKNSYEPIQNEELFKIGDVLAQETSATFHTAGALGIGEEVWVLMSFEDAMTVEGDPRGEMEKYFLIRSSHDGSHALDVRFTPVRVVCQNTMNMAVSGSQSSFSIRHTKGAEERLRQVRKSLKAASAYYDEIEGVLSAWTSEPLRLEDFIADVADELFPEPDRADEERSSYAQKSHDTLCDLFEGEAEGMTPSIRNTRYGALQAVTEYADHHKRFQGSGRFSKEESRFRSIVDGSSRRFKNEGFKLIAEAGDGE